jgi:hypothetical protein
MKIATSSEGKHGYNRIRTMVKTEVHKLKRWGGVAAARLLPE